MKGVLYLSEEALWIMELLKMQYVSLKDAMASGKIRRELFDKLSYSSWAVSESIRAINEIKGKGWVDEYAIAEILQIQLNHYIRFGSTDKECHKKYIYAADMIEQLILLTGGSAYDQRFI